MARKKLDPDVIKGLIVEMREATGEDRLETIDDIEEMAVQIGNRVAQELIVQELAERLDDAPESCHCPHCEKFWRDPVNVILCLVADRLSQTTVIDSFWLHRHKRIIASAAPSLAA
jgi:hypothetical protein